MQITSWLPRQPLPFAAPSRPELLETPPGKSRRCLCVRAPRSMRRRPASRKPRRRPAHRAWLPPRPWKAGDPDQPAEAGRPGGEESRAGRAGRRGPAEPPAVQAPPPRFALQLLQAGSCTLLVELPTGEPFASRDPGYLLLRDLLRAAGLPDSPRLIGEPVRWPLLARGNLDQAAGGPGVRPELRRRAHGGERA